MKLTQGFPSTLLFWYKIILIIHRVLVVTILLCPCMVAKKYNWIPQPRFSKMLPAIFLETTYHDILPL